MKFVYHSSLQLFPLLTTYNVKTIDPDIIIG